ncbi:MAG: hypothetical protein ACRDBO_16380 [Lachnospiraceae bacterium]
MVRNRKVSLDKNSKERQEALGFIKQAMLLDYAVPNGVKDEGIIIEVMNSCQKCCSQIFASNEYAIQYNFFGEINFDGKPQKSVFSYFFFEFYFKDLEKERISSGNKYSFLSKTGMSTLILQHCVLSAYHALLMELSDGCELKSYGLRNKTKDKGFRQLLAERIIAFEENEEKLKKIKVIKKDKDISKNSRMASDFTQKANTQCKNIPGIKDLFTYNNEKEEECFFIQYAGLFYKICNIRANRWLSFFRALTARSKRPPEDFNKIPGELFNDESKKINKTDDLYNRYLLERIFSFDLVNCLLQNMFNIELNSDHRLRGNELLSVLHGCKKLPNAFSRKYFIQYAFDMFFVEPDSHFDYWERCKMRLEGTAVGSTSGIKGGFQVTSWIQQFEQFCDYMASFVIPIYEWCFINILMEIMEDKMPEASYQEHLMNGVNILSAFITENYERLLNPIDFYKDSDNDRIKELKIIQPDSTLQTGLPKEVVDFIFKEFYQEDELKYVDLNLKLLNPEYFKKRYVGRHEEPYRAKVRNFYSLLTQESFIDNQKK